MAVQAVYPNGIPVFKTHKNRLDDVDAEDVNWIQRELTSALDIVGQRPHVYNDITSTTTYVTAPPGGTGDLTEVFPSTFQFTPSVGQVDYGNVSHRLDEIQRGTSTHVFGLLASNLNLPKIANVSTFGLLKGVKFPAPLVGNDPFALYNGLGVTIKKSGWWVLTSQLIINLLGTQAEKDGAYQATITVNGAQVAQDRERCTDSSFGKNPGSIILQPVVQGWLSAGAYVDLRVGQDSSRTHQIQRAVLCGSLVREV